MLVVKGSGKSRAHRGVYGTKKEEIMKRVNIYGAAGLFTLLVLAWTPADTAAAFGVFQDGFKGGILNPTKWMIFRGNPIVSNRELILAGGATAQDRAEIQSVPMFMQGTWRTVIDSSDWNPQSESTDSSFGFEIFTGHNGNCHYAITFVASGHLAILESTPDANGDCFGDPAHQAFIPVSNWDAVRAGGTVHVRLTWSPTEVTLYVSDGGANNGLASYQQPVIPDPNHPALSSLPLKIRLNADIEETYAIKRIRFRGNIF